MAFNDIEQKRTEKVVGAFIEKRRPPPHIRPELDLGFRIHGQSVEIFEIRPMWQAPDEKMEHPVAKATYVKTQRVWKVYWQRADLKWHGYPPAPQVKSLEEFLALVDKDEHYCFFG
ncbi:DUF3024 domain-containing protein [Stutzerimonas nitrititolerans]|uniref:DUF3024 domain-containing protein n=1 Tax=Stutzerimonas nitrititolerans TaxID=2482751 RepID=UPI0026491DB9|nr:DUF3024 domain-containing protein [Stutzerimonas nitrititolerans]